MICQHAKRYAIVGTGSRAGMYIDAATGRFSDCAELVGLCDLSQTRMDWHNGNCGARTAAGADLPCG